MCSLFGYFKEIILSLLIPSPLVEGIMCMGGRDRQPLSVFLVGFLMLSVCLTLSSLSDGGLVVMKMLISLSPGGPDCSVVPLTRSCTHALAAY